jgi:hypothetical protein
MVDLKVIGHSRRKKSSSSRIRSSIDLNFALSRARKPCFGGFTLMSSAAVTGDSASMNSGAHAGDFVSANPGAVARIAPLDAARGAGCAAPTALARGGGLSFPFRPAHPR